MSLCERCGLNLDGLGMYVDFVHYRADQPSRRVPCVELSSVYEQWLDSEAAYLSKRLAETLNKVLKEQK